jgi:hypothetical protein
MKLSTNDTLVETWRMTSCRIDGMLYSIWAAVVENQKVVTEYAAAIEATKIKDAIEAALSDLAYQYSGCSFRIIEVKLQSSKRCEDIDKYTD